MTHRPRQQDRIEGYFQACRDTFDKKGHGWAFTCVVCTDGGGEAQLGVAEYNIGGYTPVWVYFDSYEEAARCADELNARLGLDKKTAAKIICSSMRWPAGDRSAI